ncbi:Zinc transporter 1 [Morella rubra]|uniref:Zinc transporter 1 n=1 Tax=Morella rubra TaxID=262757 RepID=A0A6A1UKV9_9ROSI|nr:Zinc transporter 1 [Morella rubra]
MFEGWVLHLGRPVLRQKGVDGGNDSLPLFIGLLFGHLSTGGMALWDGVGRDMTAVCGAFSRSSQDRCSGRERRWRQKCRSALEALNPGESMVFDNSSSEHFCSWSLSLLLPMERELSSLGHAIRRGVFLGTSLMHFLSDSNGTFETPRPKHTLFFASVVRLSSDHDYGLHSGLCYKASSKEARVQVQAVEEGRTPEELSKHHEHMDLNPEFWRKTNVGDTILLILALCFHSVFEGIAVGVAATEGDAWKNLWTICLHKLFAAVGMGIALLRMLPKRPFLTTAVYSFAFAISSPIGVGIGIAIDATTQGPVADWIYAISMGIACGVFIYVAINHLIAKGFKPQSECYFDTPFFKFLAVLLGVGVIAVVMIWDT